MEMTVITRPDYFSGEGELINKLFESGLQSLHLRKPVNDELSFKKLMSEIDPVNYPQLSIHQHHELAPVFDINRLHFTELHRKDMDAVERKELLLRGCRLTTSVHEFESIAELEDFTYVFFGPVFNSISKAGYSSKLKPNFVLPAHKNKIFAIGGITAGNLFKIKQMGFEGAAVLGAVWQQTADPVAAAIQLIKSINQIGNGDR